jgi:hypothetical protein
MPSRKALKPARTPLRRTGCRSIDTMSRLCQTCWDAPAEQGNKQCLRCQQRPDDPERISPGRLMVKREGTWNYRSLDNNGNFKYETVPLGSR